MGTNPMSHNHFFLESFAWKKLTQKYFETALAADPTKEIGARFIVYLH